MFKKSLSLFLMGISLVCYAQDGTLDLTFNPPVHPEQPEYNGFYYGEVNKILPLSNGRLFISGTYEQYQGSPVGPVVVLNANGTVDDGFDLDAGLETLGLSLSWFYDAAVQADGKIVISARFETANGFVTGLVRLNDDGSADTTFEMDAWTAGSIGSIAVLPDGKIICAGYFYQDANLNPYLSVVRLDSNGSVDATYSAGTGFAYEAPYDPVIYSIAVQPDGKVLIGGVFASYNGTAVNRLMRLTANGDVDTTFTINIPGMIYDVREVLYDAAQQKIYVAGLFSPDYIHDVIRLDDTGSIDTGFNFNAVLYSWYGDANAGSISDILLLQDGKIAVGGDFTHGENVSLLLLNTNGGVESNFQARLTGGFHRANTMVQANGGIYVGGAFEEVNLPYNYKSQIVKLQTDGKTDLAFNPNWGSNAGGGSCVGGFGLANGDMVVTSQWSHDFDWPNNTTYAAYNERPAPASIRINADGSIDTDTYSNFIASAVSARTISYDANSKLIMSNMSVTYKLLENGQPDASFPATTGIIAPNPINVNVFTNAQVTQPDGKIVIGGNFRYTSLAGSSYRQRIMRVDTDGNLDALFNVGKGFNGSEVAGNEGWEVNALALLPDGKILAAGNFTSFNDQPVKNIARLNADGTLDTTFMQGTGFDGDLFSQVNGMVRLSNGKILVCGNFTSYNGTPTPYIARLNANGTLDTTFTSPFEGSGYSYLINLLVQPDGKIIVSGEINEVALLKRLNVNGDIDTTFYNDNTFEPQADVLVKKMALLSDQRILLTGEFKYINGIRRVGIAVLNNTPTVAGLDSYSQDEAGITAVPNPVADVLHLEAPVDLGAISIYTITGQTVYTGSAVHNSVNVAGLAPGIYMVRAQAGDAVYTTKIVKQ